MRPIIASNEVRRIALPLRKGEERKDGKDGEGFLQKMYIYIYIYNIEVFYMPATNSDLETGNYSLSVV